MKLRRAAPTCGTSDAQQKGLLESYGVSSKDSPRSPNFASRYQHHRHQQQEQEQGSPSRQEVREMERKEQEIREMREKHDAEAMREVRAF